MWHAGRELTDYPLEDQSRPASSNVDCSSITALRNPTSLRKIAQQGGDKGEELVRSLLQKILGKQLGEVPEGTWPKIMRDHLAFPFNKHSRQTDLLAELTEDDMQKFFTSEQVLAFPLVEFDDEKLPAFQGTKVVGEFATKFSIDNLRVSDILLKKRQQLALDNMVLLQSRHPIDAAEVIRYSLIVIAVHELPENARDRGLLQQKTRDRLLHDILCYPVDNVLAAVGRLWVLFVTDEDVGELISKVLETLSVASGDRSRKLIEEEGR